MEHYDDLRKVTYKTRDDGAFVIENYPAAKPFSNFLPGVAGLWGIPMWAFYVNRGQGICTFGLREKGASIMEFNSAHIALRRVETDGFRTFLKVKRGNGACCYFEPFSQFNETGYQRSSSMFVRPHDLTITETNQSLNLEVSVNYFTLPGEAFPALIRRVDIKNLSADPVHVEILDGFPMLLPFGLDLNAIKLCSFARQSMCLIENIEEMTPYYRLKRVVYGEDGAGLSPKGTYYMGFRLEDGEASLVRPIVDPQAIFGDMQVFYKPHRFMQDMENPYPFPQEQDTVCQMPCAFSYDQADIVGNGTYQFASMSGILEHSKWIAHITQAVSKKGYLDRKQAENEAEVTKVRHTQFVHSGNPALDQFFMQTNLDNTLRGGYPITLTEKNKKAILYAYSRLHGDLERDYGAFVLEPTYFSQGNGAYRDINQNHRLDTWMNPDAGSETIRYFFNLIQLDGFNTYELTGSRYRGLGQDKLAPVLQRYLDENDQASVARIVQSVFTAGSLFHHLIHHDIVLKGDRLAFLQDIIAHCEPCEDTPLETPDSYWIDHFIYNFDLLQHYLAIFPDKAREMLVERTDFVYWDMTVQVNPRSEKNVLMDDHVVRQQNFTRKSPEKVALIKSRSEKKQMVRTQAGKGDIYHTNYLGKAITLLCVKLAAIAPSGIGIEMEAGGPGWYDSMGGLPVRYGSSTCEIFALLRYVDLLESLLANMEFTNDKQTLPIEVFELFEALTVLMKAYQNESADRRDFNYWDKTNTARETYRDRVFWGLQGEERSVAHGLVMEFLALAKSRLNASIQRSRDKESGLFLTYARHDPVEYEIIKNPDRGPQDLRPGTMPRVAIKKFAVHVLPAFLEGPMHAMQAYYRGDAAKKAWRDMRRSELYDKGLKMYTANVSLSGEPIDLGKSSLRPPGWSENESVFTHMEYKYLLAMLYAGLYDEYYEDMFNCFLVFHDPRLYARSPYESSSFIVCSRHPRKDYVGRGFAPRLSGANVEVLTMLMLMSFGQSPFTVSADGTLMLAFKPVLSSRLFTLAASTVTYQPFDGASEALVLPAKTFTVLFLGGILVTYHNPKMKNTFGTDSVGISGYRLLYHDGTEREIQGGCIRGRDALDVRERRVKRIAAALA